jgi:hypothetical protein
MYAIAERRATIGSVISRDNSRLWIKRLRDDGTPVTTPASDEAMSWDTRRQANIVARQMGDWWTVVKVD